MAITVTQVASGNWTDFNTPTDKTIVPSETIPAGDVAFFTHGTTVEGAVTPGSANYGGIDAMTDNLGNTWTLDSWGPPIDGVDSGTTCEIWRCDVVTPIPTVTGVILHITPDGRGMSSDWFFLHVTGLPTNSIDQVGAQAKSGFNSNWPSGTTPATTQDVELVIAVAGSSTASNINAAPAGWTLAGNYSGSGSGSAKSHAVAYLLTSVAGAQSGVFTSVSSGSAGAGCIATYKSVGSPAAPSGVTDLADVTAAQTAGYTLTQRTKFIRTGVTEFISELKIMLYPSVGERLLWGAVGSSFTSQAAADTAAVAALNAQRRHRYAGAPGRASGAAIVTTPHGETLVVDVS